VRRDSNFIDVLLGGNGRGACAPQEINVDRPPYDAAVAVTIRPACADDLVFLVELLNHDDVRPWLAGGRSRDRAELEEELDRRLVIEVDGERAGTCAFRVVNERSRIAHLGGLAVHPRFRGARVADEAARLVQRHLIRGLGFHRLELEVYAFNERALVHAERAGFVREGVKRKAYRRGDGWVDSVLFGFVEEDLAAT
jgi:RimJ/RimL family protein N-acetyltransferase